MRSLLLAFCLLAPAVYHTATMQAFLRSGGLDSALEALISRATLKEYAQRYGLRAGDNLVNSEIRMIPAFRGPDGNFSEDTYRQALALQRVTDAQLREDLGIGLLSQQMLIPAGFGASVPDKLAYRYAQLFKERRQGSIALLPASTYAPSDDPETEVLRAYYDANRADFVSPERRNIRYATFDSAALGDGIEPTDAEIAARYGKTAAQVALRWQIEIGNCAIPKSVNPGRIRENLDIFDFALTAQEVAAISALDTGHRGGPDPERVEVSSFNLIVED